MSAGKKQTLSFPVLSSKFVKLKTETPRINLNEEKLIIHDQQFQSFVGSESIRHFYRHYKSIDKVVEQNEFYKVKDSAYTIMTKHSRLPCSMGMFNRKKQDTLSLNAMSYGDHYMKILANIAEQSEIKNFELKGNRISKQSASDLMMKTMQKSIMINVKSNKVNSESLRKIGAFIGTRECKLRILDLEDNSLNSQSVIELCQAMQRNRTLLVLNLAKNRIDNKSCDMIAQMINDNDCLKELYLHYNCITAAGGVQLLQKQNSLKVLDLSLNSLGVGVDFSQCVKRFLKENQELLHLDLSFNKIKYNDAITIAEGLTSNVSIIGFHFKGNYGYVDERGFLIPSQHPTSEWDSLRIDGCRYNKATRIRDYRDSQLRDCCWICEGWTQTKIKTLKSEEPQFLHLSHRNFDDLYVQEEENIQRMLPPGLVYYFFTTGELQQIDHNSLTTKWNIKLDQVSLMDQKMNVIIPQINFIDVKVNNSVVDQFYNVLIDIAPRTLDQKYIPTITTVKRIWTFPISLFKDWREDNDELLDNCFIFDWNASRISKLIQNPQDQTDCKYFLRSQYAHLKDTYKHYASLNPIGDIWCIPIGIFQQLLSAVGLPDSGRGSIKTQDLDLKFISTLSGTEKGNPRKPDRGMIRFQFLEVWVRIAEEKYLKTGVARSYEQALNFLWEDHLNQEIYKYSTQVFRNDRYWNEQCDDCLKHYKPVLEYIFQKYSTRKVKPGQKNFMCLSELQDICTHAQLTQRESFGPTIPLLAYNKSIMTQIDEINSDKIFQMNFVEFLEAFSRIAEDLELYQELHFKIEKLILRCYMLCDGQFAKPENNLFQAL